MRAAEPDGDFAAIWRVFATQAGTLRKKLGTQSIPLAMRTWLLEEQARHHGWVSDDHFSVDETLIEAWLR